MLAIESTRKQSHFTGVKSSLTKCCSSESVEFKTVVSCAGKLEIALRSTDRDIVHFLHQEGFITQEMQDDILCPRSMLSNHQKAGELVTAIRNEVQLSAQKYHTLVNHLRQNGKQYGSIVNILDEEYRRQGT